MDADEVEKRLEEGNRRYQSGMLPGKNIGKVRESTISGQNPFVTVLTCSDSRVVPEFIFDANIGDLFVIRNAGNVVDDIVLGSMEYGVEHLKTPVLAVLGHGKCGAVTAACQGGRCSLNVKAVMDKLQASVERCDRDIERATEDNIKCVIDEIRSSSPIIRDLEKKGRVKIIGMKYFFSDGHVKKIEQTTE